MGDSKASFHQIVTLVFLVLFTKATVLGNSSHNSVETFNVRCIAEERKALLQFKQALQDPFGQLSSWVGEDCCKWQGIACSNQTGNVIELDLNKSFFCDEEIREEIITCFGGELHPSLLNLTSLNHLDLSNNNFSGTPIPSFIGSLKELRYLDLSYSSFGGMVPPHLGNLSNLQHLDLGPSNVWVSDLKWLSSLSSLKYLDLGNVDLSKVTTNWLPVVNMLPSLLELQLSFSELHDLPHSLPFVNFTSLQVFDLSSNNFKSSIFPQWLFNISTLRRIDLSYNNMIGVLPESLGSLKHLETLGLMSNSLSGPLPTAIGNLSHLQFLDLYDNMMNGTIPESIGQLTELEFLDLRESAWEGTVSEIHFQKLKKLNDFSLSSKPGSLVFNVSHEWTPLFSLSYVHIQNCRLMHPTFPGWLRTQKSLDAIRLSNVGISDSIPDWFWGISDSFSLLDLSNNNLRGKLPISVNFSSFGSVILNNNSLEGPVPLWPYVRELYLARNKLSGPIPSNVDQLMPYWSGLDLSRNNLNGSIPDSIMKIKNLFALDLSRNHLSGNIPKDIWKGSIGFIDFSNNNLSGQIPSSMCSQQQSLTWLKLSNNNLSGELEPSLQNCTNLYVLDLGGNKFSGNIPKWRGQNLPSLSFLLLGANMFTGNIPDQICNFPHLQVLNLSQNNLSGSIPICLANFEQMKDRGVFKRSNVATNITAMSHDIMNMDLKVKRVPYEYNVDILPLINSIDLSSNNFWRDIPEEIADLSGLGSLNLSRNQLTGKIPESFGSLKLVETLDLSNNHLWGQIPSTMTSMTSLSTLNLSYNNLSGPIPSANQFQTFNDPTIYEGNSGLCGPPLTVQCSGSHIAPVQEEAVVDEDGSEKIWFYASTALGFIVGFWAVFGSLVIKRSWRHAYFQFLDEMKDRLVVVIKVKCLGGLRRKIKWERQH